MRKPYQKPTIFKPEGRLEQAQGGANGCNCAESARAIDLGAPYQITDRVGEQADGASLLSLTAKVVSSYVSNNSLPAAELPAFLGKIYASLQFVSDGDEALPEEPRTLVPVKKSVTPDFIICLEDGKRLKSLKRHIATRYGLTPDQYRKKWNLPFNYPMVAPNYSATRSRLAKSMGLGRRDK